MTPEERLRLAKEALESGSYDKETVEYIFPELKKIEDAEIPKLLHKLLCGEVTAGQFEKYGLTVDTALFWLDKQIEQKPFKWSEEDEEMFDAIISDLERHGGKENSCYSVEIDWLKSLEGKVQSQWKPSEEQIQALEYQVHSTYEDAWQYRVSKELLEQLKKLKGE